MSKKTDTADTLLKSMMEFIDKVYQEQLSHGRNGDPEYIRIAESLLFRYDNLISNEKSANHEHENT